MHSSCTSALASFTGTFVIFTPVHLPAPLVVHPSCTSALLSFTGSFVSEMECWERLGYIWNVITAFSQGVTGSNI